MDIMELGAIGELVGGVAVIATLIYVGIQVKQSTLAQNTAAGEETVRMLVGLQNTIAVDPDLSRIMLAAGRGTSDMQTQDYFRFHLFSRSMFIQFDIVRLKREAGLVDDSLWHSATSFFEKTASQRGVHQWWEKNKDDFSPQLQGYMNKLPDVQ